MIKDSKNQNSDWSIMEKVKIADVLAVTSGEIIQNGKAAFVTGVSIDSRKIKKNDCFIPFAGEKADGHNYIEKAFENGASLSLSEINISTETEGTIIKVEDTLIAMQQLAKYYRHLFDIPVIAVTGSSGKTTTKDIIATILSVKYKVMKTQGNFNNAYGVPQTLFNLDNRHEIAVIEMGMDREKEIEKIIDLVEPHISVITNIGYAHIEYLKTQENIYKAKKEILETLTAKDYAVVNGDDEFLGKMINEKEIFNLIKVGINSDELDLKAVEIQQKEERINYSVEINHKIENYNFRIPGEHNIYNGLMGIWIGHYFGLTQKEIQQGLTDFVPSANRMAFYNINGTTIINDSYNANPDSMIAGLKVLKNKGKGKRKIAVLGDMLEMGEYAKDMHKELGEKVSEYADILIAVGEYAYYLKSGAENCIDSEKIYIVKSAAEAGKCLEKIMNKDDVVLLKGSRGIGLEKSLYYLQGKGE
jgi:UDP-N-acetylmuramoyl-tripeptide--D-alanyl-D-alanine ligase